MNRITRNDLHDLLQSKSGERNKGITCKTYELSFKGPSSVSSLGGNENTLCFKKTIGVTSMSNL